MKSEWKDEGIWKRYGQTMGILPPQELNGSRNGRGSAVFVGGIATAVINLFALFFNPKPISSPRH
jgi:hypothetical protein